MAQWKRRLITYKYCGWIEQSPSFSKWTTISVNEMNHQERKLLLIRGTPGSGKSTLLYYILNRFVRFDNDGQFVTIIISHWCNRRYDETLTFSSMIRSFLWQLLFIKPSAFQVIWTSWLGFPQGPDELLSLLSHILKDLSNQHVLFLVDGIDSIQEEQEGLMSSMWDLFKVCSSVKMVFTSQDEYGGNRFLDNLLTDINPSIVLLPYNVDGLLPEIRSLSYHHIAGLIRSTRMPYTLSKEILDVAWSKSRGNYLWIALYFRLLEQKKSIHSIQHILRHVSSDLFSLYHQLLAERPESQMKGSELILYTIQHSLEPLRPRDLAAVMAILEIDDLEDDQQDHEYELWSRFEFWSSSDSYEGLPVNVDTGRAFFTHDSFSAYLKHASSEILQRHNHEDTHCTLALACVRWLEYCGNRKDNPHNMEFSEVYFWVYAARHWHKHVRKAIYPSTSLIQAVHSKFLDMKPAYLHKVNVYAQLDIQIPGDDENILHFAAAVGLEFTSGMVRELNDGWDPNIELWDKAILRAFTNRHVSTLVHILGLIKNQSFFRKLLVEAIQKAKSPCNLETSRFVVDVLEAIDRWYFAEVDEIFGLALTPTIMLLALRHRRWEFAVEAYNSLKQYGLMWHDNWRVTDGPAILCEAMSAFQHNYNEKLKIQDFFLFDLRLDIPDPAGETPLHAAVKTGIFSYINDSDVFMADVNVTNGMGQTPLHLAAEAGFIDIVRELVSLGADTNAQDHDKVTPLHLASLYGHMEVVKFLLAVGSNPNPQDREGRTPLLMAAAGGKIGVAEILFRQGAEIDLADEKGQNPLHLATYNCCQPLATFLLRWSPSDINIKDNFGRTPLHVVSSNGLDRFAESLLSKDADATALDSNGRSALHYAVESKYFSDSLLQLLVKFGNDPNLKDNDNLSSIDLAEKIGNTKAARRLQTFTGRAPIVSQDLESTDKMKPVTELSVSTSTSSDEQVLALGYHRRPLSLRPSPVTWRAEASEDVSGRRPYLIYDEEDLPLPRRRFDTTELKDERESGPFASYRRHRRERERSFDRDVKEPFAYSSFRPWEKKLEDGWRILQERI
jgi:ankyrin repeat protein